MSEKPYDPQQELTEPQNALSPISIDELPEIMQSATNRVGWTELTPVQSRAIPYLQARRDLMVQARTGSGKTGAFILPILEQVDKNQPNCQALVLVPTRELAQQVAADAKSLAGSNGMRTVPVYGGTSYKPQIAGFNKGAHCVVGTPGRILDHLIKRNLNLKNLRFLVYDEADRMMSMGFYPDMVQIQEFLPRREISGYMFSATISAHVIRLSQQFLNSPDFLSLSSDHVHVEDTGHIYYLTPGMDKDRSLVRIIEMETPQQAIVFCNTKARVNYVAAILQRYGYNADQISSDLSQSARDKVLKRVRDGKLRFLVATDVAARGIDIPNLSHVIQYEPPEDVEAYIHRAGRTGRAGASGTAIMLININEKTQLNRIAAHYKIEFEKRPLPLDEEVQSLVAQRLVGQLEARLRARDRLQIDRMQRFILLGKQLAEDEDGLALLAMLLDDSYHDWMHQPPELPPEEIKSHPSESNAGKQKSGYRGGKKKRRFANN
ncbi:MAG: DEAD/DEAH box helicase [Anaerolineales bacterium]|nr:DEAD/DEAH box helicase [Anaerolineales bacterium]